MNKKVLLVGGLAIGYVLLREAQNLKNTVNGLRLSFLPGDWPKLDGGKLVIPIAVRVDNPGDRDLPLDSLTVNLYRVTRTGSYPVGQTPPAGVTLPIFKARETTKFSLRIETGLLDGITELATIVNSRGFNKFRVEPTVVAAGLRVPLSPTTIQF